MIRLCLVFAVSLATVAMPVRHCADVSSKTDRASTIQSAIGVAGLHFGRLGETDDDSSRGSRDRFRPSVDLTTISINGSGSGTDFAYACDVTAGRALGRDRPLRYELCKYLI